MLLDVAIYWLSTLFLLTIIILFMGDLCSWDNVNRRYLIYVCFIYLILSIVTSLISIPTVINPLISYLGNFILLLAFKTSNKNRFIYALMITVICAICDAASYYMLTIITGSTTTNIISYLGTVLLVLTVERLAKIALRDKYAEDIFSGQGIVLITIPISSLILLYTCLRERIYSVNLFIVSICILVINATVVYIFRIISQNHLQALHIAEMEGRIAAFNQENEIVLQKQQHIYTLEHDMHHHIIELMGRTNKGDIIGIRSYLENMQSYMEEHESCDLSGNFTADSLVDYWIRRAKDKSITMNASVEMPWDLKINGALFNLILGNLLENAVEATQKSHNKYIELEIKYATSDIYIKVTNSYDESTLPNLSVTSKKTNPTKHGFGRYSIKSVLKELDAIQSINITDDYVIEEILIPIRNITDPFS